MIKRINGRLYAVKTDETMPDGSRLREFIPVLGRILQWLTRPEEIRPEEIQRRLFIMSELI